MSEKTKDPRNLKIDEVGFSTRIRNCIDLYNCWADRKGGPELKTMGDLADVRDAELLKVRGFGSKMLDEVHTELYRLGLRQVQPRRWIEKRSLDGGKKRPLDNSVDIVSVLAGAVVDLMDAFCDYLNNSCAECPVLCGTGACPSGEVYKTLKKYHVSKEDIV